MNDAILLRRFWTCLALAVLLIVAVGCATLEYDLPVCGKITIHQAETAIGTLFVLDAENLQTLAERMKGLWERTCKPSEGV